MDGSADKSIVDQALEWGGEALDTTKKWGEGTWDKLKAKAGNAMDAWKNNEKDPWYERIGKVFSAFWEDVQAVDKEEAEKKSETAIAAGAELKKTDHDKLVDGLIKSPDGTAGDASPANAGEYLESQRAVTSAAVDAATEIDDEKRAKGGKDGEVLSVLTSAADKIDSDKDVKLTADEKTGLIACGARMLAKLKAKFPRKEDFAKALSQFDQATLNTHRGLAWLKSDHVKEIFKGGVSGALALKDKLQPVLDKIGLPLVNPFGTSLNDVRKKLTGGELSGSDANELQGYFANLFPKTSPDKRASALQTISKFLSAKVKFPTNEQITDLAYDIDTGDLETLSNLVAA